MSEGVVPRPQVATITTNVRRDEAIRAARSEGLTLTAVGRRFGLTRERVRQIAAKEAIVPVPAAERLTSSVPYQRLIENLGWDQEGGRHDDGCWFVRIWNEHDERIFTSSRYADLPTLYARAAEHATANR